MKKANKLLLTANKSVISVGLLFLLLTLTFAISFKTKFAVNYDSFNGRHSWLSGSTIKFVNNWLIETPQKLHFVNFDLPDSIEFNELAERDPYISYPSGCTFFVYVFAKMLGRQTIDISFLKHFQLFCFWLETLLLAIFVYRFLKNNGIKSEVGKTAAAFLTAIFWAWMPTNVWYLANVYFADQCVILFVMAFLYVEYESYGYTNTRLRFIVNSIKAVIIFSGILIDYYFWFFTLVAFVLQILYSMKNKKTLVDIIKASLWYVIPVILALGVYICQLISVPNCMNKLSYVFLYRTGVAKIDDIDKRIFKVLCQHIVAGFGLKTNLHFIVLFMLILCLHSDKIKISRFFTILKESLFTKNGIIILLGTIAPIFQIIVLKNHSAVHSFSIVK